MWLRHVPLHAALLTWKWHHAGYFYTTCLVGMVDTDVVIITGKFHAMLTNQLQTWITFGNRENVEYIHYCYACLGNMQAHVTFYFSLLHCCAATSAFIAKRRSKHGGLEIMSWGGPSLRLHVCAWNPKPSNLFNSSNLFNLKIKITLLQTSGQLTVMHDSFQYIQI